MKKLLLVLSAVFALTTSYSTQKNKVQNPIASPVLLLNAAIDSTLIKEKSNLNESQSQLIYKRFHFNEGNSLEFNVFEKALLGFNNLKKSGKISETTKYLTVCDFSLSSNKKRLWVFDMENGIVVFNSLVAHGKNTGEEFATQFSNIESSYQSSLGFYITDLTYEGSNGYSLKLMGLDKGFNDNAMQRAIVMHGADYVSEDFAKQHKRIGRSWGCPAVPQELASSIIDTIKGKNVLFIYSPDQDYLQSSEWLKS